jgi:hypothetical protein
MQHLPAQKYNLLLRLLICLLVSWCASAFAQQASMAPSGSSQILVPHLIRFAGTVQGGSGTVGITFTLHKGQDDNAALWVESQNVQLDGAGKYTVLLGATKAEGIPAELFTSGEAQWLGVQVQGKPEQPRVLLVSVPYALKAAEADTLAGHAANEFVTSEKLNSAVQQQMQLQATAAPSGGKSTAGTSTPTDPATDFIASNTSQVVLVQQNGSGSGLTATATTGMAVNAKSAGTAIYGNNTGTGNTAGVEGITSSPAGRGVYGFNTATTGTNFGVVGAANSTAGIGVFGSNGAASGAAVGIWGTTSSTGGVGLKGAATATTGSTTGLLANVKSDSGTAAVFQNSAGGKLISAQSGTSNTEMLAVDGGGNLSTTGEVSSNTANGTAVSAETSASGGTAVFANAGSSGGSSGVTAYGGTGVVAYGTVSGGTGVYANAGSSASSNGVVAQGATGIAAYTTVDSSIAIYGNAGSTANSYGLYGIGSIGVVGNAGSGAGTTGIYGEGATGVTGISLISGSNGVYGAGSTGVNAQSGDGSGDGLVAYNSSSGDGMLVGSNTGWAAWFNGNVDVDGTLSNAAGALQIDHPLDPTNKYLYHSFVESPDMMNIYNGNITTDASGNAVVTMPDWFESLNRDFRYQLTVMGQFAQAIVASEIANGRFEIKTDKPNVKVSWMVTGVRQDPWANAHRIPVEQAKPDVERGSYLHPELYGAPAEKGVLWARHPKAMQQWKAAREKTAAGEPLQQPLAPPHQKAPNLALEQPLPGSR